MPTSSMKNAVFQLRKALLRDVAGLTDSQLLDSFVAERDEAAFETIVRQHGPMVMGVCRRILGSVHDAEDAFQAVFLVLARKAASISRKELLANWLYGVAQRTSLAAKGKMARQRSHEIQVKDMPQPAAKAPAPCHDWLPLLDAELSKLPDKYRIPIVLCDLEGRTRQQAARQLKIPEGTLSSRLATARKLLAHRLGRHGSVLSGAALAVPLAQGAASAAVPTTIISFTVAAAASIAAGKTLPAGVVSAQATALAEGVLKAMLLTKLKIIAVLALILCALGTGASFLTQRTLAAGQQEAKKEPAPKLESKAPGAPAAKPKEDKELLQGTWHIVEVEVGGKHQAKERSKDQILVFTRDKLVIKYDDGSSQEMMVQIDPKQKPRAIDLAPLAEPEKGYTFKGIYELDGDRLKLYYSRNVAPDAERPARFVPEFEDRGMRSFVLKRAPGATAQEKQPREDADVKPKADAGGPVHSLPGHKERLTSVAYSSDGQCIATAGWDGTIRLWNPKSGKEVRRLDVPATRDYHTAHLSQILFSPDSEFVVVAQQSAPNEPGVIVWNRRTGERVRDFPGLCVAIAPDGKHIACGGWGDIRLYEFATGKLVREIHSPYSRIEGLVYSRDGKMLFASVGIPRPPLGGGIERLGEDPAEIRAWDVATGKERRTGLNGEGTGSENQIAVSPDGRTLALANSLRETATGGHRVGLTDHSHGSSICAVAFSPDGRTVATGGMDGTVRLWDLPSGKEIGRFGKEVERGKGGWVLSVAFSPDGRTLVSGGLDKTAHIWDVSKITSRRGESAERSSAELEADWNDLGGDTAKAYAALGRLISSPKQAVSFLGKQLQSAKAPDTKRIEQLIGNLDDDRFQVRQQATKELEALGEYAAHALEKALAGNPSLEVKRRLAVLLDRLDGARLSAETLCHLRAVEALEFIGNPEALRLLEKLATGPPEMRLTQEAKVSVGRLARRPWVGP